MRLPAALMFIASGVAALASSAKADSGAFVVRLGADTVSVETFVRSPSRLEIDQVLRSPRTQRRRYVYEFTKGALTRVTMAVSVPGDSAGTQTMEGEVDDDSLRVNGRGTFLPVGAPVIRSPIPWAAYEAEAIRLARTGEDSLRTTMAFLGATARWWLRMRRLGSDSLEIANQHDDLFHARVDAEGRILGARPIEGTFKVSVERVGSIDLEALVTSFAARDREGVGMGQLSPRDTVQSEVGGVSLWVDYSRPTKRGRVVFGDVVPWGELWRTGANAATQFRCDHDLDFGGVIVPAGLYSLWTIPSPDHWILVVNSESGQWGTRHDASRDLARIQMRVVRLPESVERFTILVESVAEGGVLRFEWDTMRASATFAVRR